MLALVRREMPWPQGLEMSLILDALNRSRQKTDDVPTLGTRHGMAGDYDRRSAR